MKCVWQAYINILPHWMRPEVDKLGRERLQELRLRVGMKPELIFQEGVANLDKQVTNTDLAFIINSASSYSPWAAGTIPQGYLTAAGGHRIGICGVCIIQNGRITGFSSLTSLCLRVARDFQDIANHAVDIQGSLLIIGPPGSGKTTLLRDLIRCKSNINQGSIAVVDEREELFPMWQGQVCFSPGDRTDIISGCNKAEGIEAVLRSMNPTWIAVDEITIQSDAESLLHAGWCGVNLMATAHASSIDDLKTRPIYQPLIQNHLFSTVLILHRDKSWSMERM